MTEPKKPEEEIKKPQKNDDDSGAIIGAIIGGLSDGIEGAIIGGAIGSLLDDD